MDENLNFNTFLFLSSERLAIKVFEKQSLKKKYFEEKILEKNLKDLNFDVIDQFLEQNIFKIEKKIKSFVKSINLIIDSNDFFMVKISLKKNKYGEMIKKNDLLYLLNEARYECKKTIDDRKITHMLIDNYLVDKKEYLLFPIDLKGQFFSIDLTFICLSNIFIKKIEKVLNKYQITTNHILYSKYIERFQSDQNEDIFKISMKMIDGHNENEVSIVPKKPKNLSFFERFFNFFS
mgnify:CR=1 FL=1|tara:strand:+ start:1578 stop:2282 length:705 start_codon:yes stop_codon:yes gene_type:complete